MVFYVPLNLLSTYLLHLEFPLPLLLGLILRQFSVSFFLTIKTSYSMDLYLLHIVQAGSETHPAF